MSRVFRVLSFDPGVTCCGWAISEFDTATGVFKVIDFGQLKSSAKAKKIMNKDVDLQGYDQKIIALDYLQHEANELILKHIPLYVATEDAFSKKFPLAYATLMLCIYAIGNVAFKNRLPFYRIPPTVAKKASTGSGKSDKVSVQETILQHEKMDLSNVKHLLETLSEHEADAIIIGYALALEKMLG